MHVQFTSEHLKEMGVDFTELGKIPESMVLEFEAHEKVKEDLGKELTRKMMEYQEQLIKEHQGMIDQANDEYGKTWCNVLDEFGVSESDRGLEYIIVEDGIVAQVEEGFLLKMMMMEGLTDEN